jgi:hypothetical protein
VAYSLADTGFGFALVLLGCSIACADGLEPGLWGVVNKPQINGIAGDVSQNTRCLSAADVEDLGRTFSPVSRTVNSTCERTEYDSTPQRLKWHLQCRGQLDMDVNGEFIFDNPRHYSAIVIASSSMMGRLMQSVLTEIEGRWIGACR